MEAIENVNKFSNLERGICRAELVDILNEIPNDISLVCSKLSNIDLVKDGTIVGRVELNNRLGFRGKDRLSTTSKMLQEIHSVVTTDGITGGDGVTFDSETYVFSGVIAYAEGQESGFPPVGGNYVGVQITAPDGVVIDKQNAKFTYINRRGEKVTLVHGETPWTDGENFVWYYPLIEGNRRVFEIEIDWDGTGRYYKPELITITVSNEAILESAE